MALSDANIMKSIRDGGVNIDPFEDSSLGPAGYDLRADEKVILRPNEQKLVSTLERVELSPSLLGILHLRSSFAREGIFASLALIDPGFRGQLTVSLLNMGREEVKIERGEPFLQLTLIKLSSEAAKSYEGRYQGSFGIVRSKRSSHVKKSSNVA